MGGSATAFVYPGRPDCDREHLGITTLFWFWGYGRSVIQVRRAFVVSTGSRWYCRTAIDMAQTARKEGLLALQKHLEPIQDLEGLVQGLSVVLDGNSAEEAEKVMQQEFEAMWMRQHRTINI